jgi:hypothetical protein
MIGEVWIGRGSYQIKRRGGTIHRFAVIYNRNNTTGGDSTDYRSTTAQGTYLLTAGGNAVSLNGGWMVTPRPGFEKASVAGQMAAGQDLRNTFLAASWSRPVGKQASANLGGDAAFAAFGLQRAALTVGGAYMLEKQPLSFQLQARYSRFRTDEVSDRSTIIAAMLGASWRFKTKSLQPGTDHSLN